MANLSRHHDVDPEWALARANAKFRRRFAHIERSLAASGRDIAATSLEELDCLWDEAKRLERGDDSG